LQQPCDPRGGNILQMGSCRKQKHPDVTPSVHDVIVPFRERIPADTLRFSIQIPRLYAPKRLFHFNRLFLGPNLFNIEAQELKVEAKVEDKMTHSFVVNLMAKFSNPKGLFPIPTIIKCKPPISS
jgi:hypothetical protein